MNFYFAGNKPTETARVKLQRHNYKLYDNHERTFCNNLEHLLKKSFTYFYLANHSQ